MSGPTRTLRFIGTELQNRKRFLKRCGEWARGVPQLGGPACCRAGRAPGVGGSGHWTLLLLRSLDGLLASVVVSGCRGLSRDGLGDGGGRRAGAEPGEEEALQFGLVFMASALAQGWSGPPGSGSGSGAGLSQRPRWRWTGRHLAVLPGSGRGLHVGSAHG